MSNKTEITTKKTVSQKPKGYWKDFANLRAELLAFTERKGTAGQMPSSTELRDAGRGDLESPILQHGGSERVARRLNLRSSYTAKPPGYWDDLENVRIEIGKIIGNSNKMPTKTSLEKAGRNDLAVAIGRKHDGFNAVAKKLGLEPGSDAKAAGYWANRDNVVSELRQFIADHGEPGRMPFYDEMRKKGKSKLGDAISKLGGPRKLAEELGWTYTNTQRPQGHYNRFENLASEIVEFLKSQDVQDTMPTDAVLRAAGQTGILNGMRKFGGSNAVAVKLGLKQSSSAKEAGYWRDFENVKSELLEFAQGSADPEKMPSMTDLQNAGLSTLAAMIATQFGGFEAVAKNLGLRFDGAGIGWTIEKLRNFVSSLLQHLHTFTPAELYILFQQSGLWQTEGKSRAFIRALSTGRFPEEELQKFVDGNASLVDNFIDDRSVTLENTLAQYLEEDLEDKDHIIADDQIEKPEALPSVATKEVLKTLELRVVAMADAEAAEFLVASALAKIWKHAYHSEAVAVSEAESFTGQGYAQRVKEDFLGQYRKAKQFEIPTGYSFKLNGDLVKPNLMQRHVASRVQQDKRMGNWSGTGAGKTLSAVLASRVTHSELTVICCPNSVVKGWEDAIIDAFPDSIVRKKTFDPKWPNTGGLPKARYLVLNYETFQQPDSASKLQQFLERERIDFVVVDEIHYTKHRKAEDDPSQRRKLVTALTTAAASRNPNLHILGMSATPVVNNLHEGKSLIELITGFEHHELSVRATIPNCMALHQRLVTLGIRWMPEYELRYEQIELSVDVGAFLPEIRALGKHGSHLAFEQILTRARLPFILEHIRPKTLIYTYNVEAIDRMLREAIEAAGWKVGFYTGDDKSGLENFISGSVDVLIGSAAIGTGVDGLQQVCNRLIVNVLPWTAAEFEQLKGRLYRQGQQSNTVTMILPLTFAMVNGERWSWCESKMHRLLFKKSIADAAVDGVVPEGHLRFPEQAYQDIMIWLQRLESGKVQHIARNPIVVPLPDVDLNEVARRKVRYGDFSTMNRNWNQTRSSTTHERLRDNPEEWAQYHTFYKEARQDWTVIPYEEMINWFKKRNGLVIGDFGCGEAELSKALSSLHTIHSFDHVAIDDSVISCDMSHVPLDDQSLDAAIFSLSLMGHNFGDYLREAYRTLKLDGHLHILERSTRFTDRQAFIEALRTFGFDIIGVEDLWKFTHIRGLRTDRRPEANVKIIF